MVTQYVRRLRAEMGLPATRPSRPLEPPAPAPPTARRLTVAATTNEHKAALRLLGVLPLAGAVVTADAMFTHPDVAHKILASGVDYVLYAKRNQTALRADLEATFTAAESGGFSPAVQAAWAADVRTIPPRNPRRPQALARRRPVSPKHESE